jgi:hypothetical protein
MEASVSEVAISFEWSRAYSSKQGTPAYIVDEGKIQQVGGRKQSYSPLRLAELYLEFAHLNGSPEACLGFAEKWGLLCKPASLTSPPSEDLAFWRAEIKRMASNLRMLPHVIRVANSRGTFAKVGKVDVLLVPGASANDPPRMVMEPGDLLQAMNLEMAHFISGGGRLITCRNCGVLFKAGKAGGKRTIAQFHNNECRIAFNNAKRRSK